MASRKPFFSIIIPTLNEADYLPVLLNDLSNQSFSDFETTVVDAASTDNTAALAKEFRSLTPQILITKKKNVAFQRNMGAKQAEADWLIFLDADNQLPPYYLEGLKYQLAKNPTDCFTTLANPDSTNAQDKAIITAGNVALLVYHTLKQAATYGAIIGVKRDVFAQLHGFDETMPYLEDWDFIKRLHKQDSDFKVFSDPRITCSLRRFRSEGTIKMLRRLSKIQLKLLMNYPELSPKDYPMPGGSYYQKSHQLSPFNFEQLNSTLNQLTTKQKQKITRLIKSAIYNNF